jgi:hypothetical protein
MITHLKVEEGYEMPRSDLHIITRVSYNGRF